MRMDHGAAYMNHCPQEMVSPNDCSINPSATIFCAAAGFNTYIPDGNGLNSGNN